MTAPGSASGAQGVAPRPRDAARPAAVLRLLRRVTPVDLFSVSVGVWCSVFSVLVHLRHSRFASFDFDLGIFDQAVWLLAHGESFITVRGLDVFGHHASPGFYLLAPFYLLGAGPTFLNVVQVLALGAGAVAVLLVAREHLRDDWLAAGLGVAFLLHPSVQWFAQELFHPEVVALPAVLFAYLAALRRRWWSFAAVAVLATSWKEDVALAIAGLGLLLLLRREWRAGTLTVLAALGYFLVVTQVLLRGSGGEAFYVQQFYGDFGTTTSEVLRTVATEPARVVERLRDADALGYLRELGQPYAFVPLLSPLAWVVGAPQALFNLLSVQDFTWRATLHYAALPVAAATIALVEGVARVRGTGVRRILVVAVVLASLLATVTSGAAPISREFDRGMWPLQADVRQPVLERAVRLPPDDAVVSASYRLVPHLTHRTGIYSFPNPWVPTNYGLPGDRGPDPAVVDWLVVDRRSLTGADLDLFDQLLSSRAFRVVSDTEDVVVAERRR